MIEYKVIQAGDIYFLQSLVTTELNAHWSCVGGIAVAAYSGDGPVGPHSLYLQAMQKGSTT